MNAKQLVVATLTSACLGCLINEAAQAQAISHVDDYQTTCGVRLDTGEQYTYQCQVVDQYNSGIKAVTILRFPDNEVQIVWLPGHHAEMQFTGVNPINARYYESGGEISLDPDGEDKIYYYTTDRARAAYGVQHHASGRPTVGQTVTMADSSVLLDRPDQVYGETIGEVAAGTEVTILQESNFYYYIAIGEMDRGWVPGCQLVGGCE